MSPPRGSLLFLVGTFTGACQTIWGIGDTDLEPLGGGAEDGYHPGGSADFGDGGAQPQRPDGVGGGGGQDSSGGTSTGGSDAAGAGGQAVDSRAGAAGDQTGGTTGTVGAIGTDAGAAWGDNGSAGSGESTTTERIFRARYMWPTRLMQACFRLPRDADASLRDELLDFGDHVREVVEGTWSRYTSLSFWDWRECASSNQFLIDLVESEPSHSGLGYPAGDARTITLSNQASDAEILYTFGRALGFEHEYGRAAWSGECMPCQQNHDCVVGDRRTCLESGYCGVEEPESIMAAPDCGGISATRKLTAWDVVGAQRAYGRKAPGSVVDDKGRCLWGDGPWLGSGKGLVVASCSTRANQKWERSFATLPDEADFLQLQMDEPSLCTEVSGFLGSEEPARLVQGTCSRTAASQHVEFRSMQLRVQGTQCVVADGAVAGARLRARSCEIADLARWSIGDGRIELSGTGLCAAVVGGLAAPGAEFSLAACDRAALEQRLSFASGEIWYHDAQGNGLCAAVAGGLPRTGSENALMMLWDSCGLNVIEGFIFFLRGPIESAGRCFDLLEGQSHDNSPVGVAECDGSPGQDWDFHW